MRTAFAGTWPLLRTTVRQNLGTALVWSLVLAALSVSSLVAFLWVYDDDASRTALAATVGANPALSMIFGPPRDLLSADGFNAWRSGALGAFLAGLMSIVLVVRNSRAQEDSGAAEFLASSVLGRHVRLLVAVLTAGAASVLAGALTWATTVLAGGGPTATLLLAATFATSGLLFATVAATAAQLGSDARTCSTIAITILGALYLLRGYLDASQAEGWTAWLTPFGWLERVRPATDENPAPLLLAVAAAFALFSLAVLLHSRRDYGQGLVPPRPGPVRAGSTGTLWGLALRLQTTSIASWTVALMIIGLVLGTLTTSVADVLTDNPLVARVIASGGATQAGLVFGFLVTVTSLLGMLAAVFAIQLLSRFYVEESEDRAAPLLAGAVRRWQHLASHALPAFIAPALALLLGSAVLAAIAAGDYEEISFADILLQSLATIPASSVLVALALAALGAWPRIRAIGWAGVGTAFALTILGPMLDLDDRILQISPFSHVPNVTAADPSWTGLWWVGAITIALIVIAFVGYRRRDIH